MRAQIELFANNKGGKYEKSGGQCLPAVFISRAQVW
jgi:hypothetical protein